MRRLVLLLGLILVAPAAGADPLRDAGQPSVPADSVNAAVPRPAFDPDAGIDLAALYARADAAAGAALWDRRCRVCHSLDPNDNGIGPSLFDVVGAPVGFVESYRYSGALAAMGPRWTLPALSRYLASPREAAPGTRMAFAGIRAVEDRMNLIRFLQEQGR